MTVLLIASGGGHLKQLHDMAPRLPYDEELLWAVPSNSLSQSLLASAKVLPIKYNGPRSLFGVLRNSIILLRSTRNTSITAIVSTGANHALAGYPLAVLRRIPFFFIDTAARVEAPSLTGKIMAKLPGVRCFCQYPNRAGEGWTFIGSVFDRFEPVVVPGVVDEERPLKAVVMVGAMEDIGFSRMIEQCVRVLPPNAEVTWQVGPTELEDTFPEHSRFMSASALAAAIAEADVVISHAGVGSALACLELGKAPILIPRDKEHGEHVDNHQYQVARFLAGKGIAQMAEADELTFGHIREALTKAVVENRARLGKFDLASEGR